jgi:site-specific recombinase XerD
MTEINSVITKYSLSARAEGHSEKTVKHTVNSAHYFANFLGGIDDVSKVTADDLKRFIVDLRGRRRWADRSDVQVKDKISGTSINTYVRAVKAFWAWMEQQNIIKSNQLAAVPAPKLPKRLPKIIDENELKAIFCVEMSQRDKAIIMLLLDSGIRLNELVNLTVNDLNATFNGITVTGKGDKQRHVYVSTDTGVELTCYSVLNRPEPAVPTDRFFLTHDGYPLTPARVQKILQKLGEKAGIKQRLSPHKLRHSYATLSLKHGANLELLRRSMGHTDIKTTEVYLDLTDTDVQDAHKQFSPIKNLRASK